MKRSLLFILAAAGLIAQSPSHDGEEASKNRFGVTLLNANQQNGSWRYHQVFSYFGSALAWDNTVDVHEGRINAFRFEYQRTFATHFAAGLSYMKQVNSDFGMDLTQQVGGPTARMDKMTSTYTYGASGFGIALYYENWITFGVGLDQRSESASYPAASNVVMGTGSMMPGASADFSRRWVRYTLGKRFDFEHVSPYIGLELAQPMSSYDGDAPAYGPDVAKVVTASRQFGFTLGLYF